MRNGYGIPGILLMAALGFSPRVHAQTTTTQANNRPQNGSETSKPADLSGSWEPDNKRGGIGQSVSTSDIDGKKVGSESDIAYIPWALAKTKSEVPAVGPMGKFESNTDPWINYCEPPTLLRIYMKPAKTEFVQTADAVYILHEVMQSFEIVRLNSKHPADPDPTWWGDSIGWYENGDTLVIDTIGLNDKTWLDNQGHPHTEKLHMVQRFKRVNQTTLELDATMDDPGAYTNTIRSHRNFTISPRPFMETPWVCSVRENRGFFDSLQTRDFVYTGQVVTMVF